MAAYFDFGEAPHFPCQLPKQAFIRLMLGKRRDLELFFNFVNRPQTLNMLLEFACVLMLGTTAELVAALDALRGRGWGSIRVKNGDILCINYVRIGNESRTKTKSLVCVAPMKGWWDVSGPEKVGKSVNRKFVEQSSPNVSQSVLGSYDRDMIWNTMLCQPVGIAFQDLARLVAIAKGKEAQLHLAKPK